MEEALSSIGVTHWRRRENKLDVNELLEIIIDFFYDMQKRTLEVWNPETASPFLIASVHSS